MGNPKVCMTIMFDIKEEMLKEHGFSAEDVLKDISLREDDVCDGFTIGVIMEGFEPTSDFFLENGAIVEAKLVEPLKDLEAPCLPSLDTQIAKSKNPKNSIIFTRKGFPRFEQIQKDYSEFVDLSKNIRTVEAVKELCKKYPVEIEINGVSVAEFEKNGGKDSDIEWIRYNAYGCLSYIYDRFDGNPMFDVWCHAGLCEFIHDIHIEDLTEENYSKWVAEGKERFVSFDKDSQSL